MVQIPAFAMSIGTIAMPKMFHENFGEQECYGYHHMNVAFLFWGVIQGRRGDFEIFVFLVFLFIEALSSQSIKSL